MYVQITTNIFQELVILFNNTYVDKNHFDSPGVIHNLICMYVRTYQRKPSGDSPGKQNTHFYYMRTYQGSNTYVRIIIIIFI